MNKLKSCPICEGPAQYYRHIFWNKTHHQISCLNNCAHTFGRNEKDAKREWSNLYRKKENMKSKEIAVYDIHEDEIFFLGQQKDDDAMRVIREDGIKFNPFYSMIFSDNNIILGEL